MSTERAEPVWLFHFALESESGVPIPSTIPEELIDLIVDWVEKRELQIGGGYRAPDPNELQPGPIFHVEPEATENSVEDRTVNPEITR